MATLSACSGGSPSGAGATTTTGAAAASAHEPPPPAVPRPFGKLSCVPRDGIRFCPGGMTAGADLRIPSFDGVPLDADVALPATGRGPFPLIVMLHGLGGSKTDWETTSDDGNIDDVTMAAKGYAVLMYTARGFGDSCGTAASRADTPACAQGWIHLADQRYEIRDTQYLAGELVDEGLVKPQIAVTGVSYGAGQTLELAMLKNRIRLPDGRFAPWTSPVHHVPMSVAAGYAEWPWDDLATALVPNGALSTSPLSPPAADLAPVGVEKQSWVTLLYGVTAGFYDAPPGVDPGADLTDLVQRLQPRVSPTPAPRPRAGRAAPDLPLGHRHPSAGRRRPAPGHPERLDRHPVPGLRGPPLRRRAGPREGEEPPAADLRRQRPRLGPGQGGRRGPADGGGPLLPGHGDARPRHPRRRRPGRGPDLPGQRPLGPGPARRRRGPPSAPAISPSSAAAAQTVTSSGGSPAVAAALDPAYASKLCDPLPAAREPGTALAETKMTRATTLIGGLRVTADLHVVGNFPELVGRLWDVGPGGSTRQLIEAGVVRPDREPVGRPATPPPPADTKVSFEPESQRVHGRRPATPSSSNWWAAPPPGSGPPTGPSP